MPTLPPIVEVDERQFPELRDVFLAIDAGIAALVASDPAFRPKRAHRRRMRIAKSGRAALRRTRVQRKAA
ncbi:hypothetical protein GCM10007989_16050 [Devosia pacifica]|uniref:Uncharacterized protein n=1 Tax=Devosia pacifica TaxID=1335967 RepID=A0A918S350_9HYPH|nr:hypothetical protein [Devosia pacifica]GHA21499.1 hypothetical protein GCM10007989_16050 [Devosia pacifica]